jgi:hypothetical protein
LAAPALWLEAWVDCGSLAGAGLLNHNGDPLRIFVSNLMNNVCYMPEMDRIFNE